MYIMPRFSLLAASMMRRWACPSTDSGRLGADITPTSVPRSRPVPRRSARPSPPPYRTTHFATCQ